MYIMKITLIKVLVVFLIIRHTCAVIFGLP